MENLVVNVLYTDHWYQEPSKLVAWKEMLRDIRNMSLDNFSIHRIFDLLSRHTKRHGNFRRITSRGNTWTLLVCCWLRVGSYALESNVGDSTNWT